MISAQVCGIMGAMRGWLSLSKPILRLHASEIRDLTSHPSHAQRSTGFDLWYNARSFTKWLHRQKIAWVSTLKSNALITYRGRTQPVAEQAKHLPRHRIAGHTWASSPHPKRPKSWLLPNFCK